MMESKIIEILKEVLETEDVSVMTSQESCEEWDSLRHLSLVVEIETEFDIEFEPEEIAQLKSSAAIKEAVEKKM